MSRAPSTAPWLAASLLPVPELWPNDSLNIHLKHKTLVTWNTWMQHTSEADETFGTYTYNMCVKYMQQSDKTLPTWNIKTHCNIRWNSWNIRTYSCNICTKHMQHLDQKYLQHMSETDKTFWTNACNLPPKNLQQASRTLCNTCNILVYFCNIYMKHLQHTLGTSEILETYACNMWGVTLYWERPPCQERWGTR